MAGERETFRHEGYTHVVDQSLELPKEFHHPLTRLAPIQIEAQPDTREPFGPEDRQFPTYSGGPRVIVRSGKWEKYVPDDKRGFGFKPNDARYADVPLQPIGILRCHPNIETSQAPLVAAAWLGSICPIVEERRPTDAELEALQPHYSYRPENTAFYFARAQGVRPRSHFMRWLLTR